MSAANSFGQRPAWPQPQNRQDGDANHTQDRFGAGGHGQQQHPEQAGFGHRDGTSAGHPQQPAAARRQWPQPNQQSANPYPDSQLRSPWPQERQPLQRPADPLNRGEQPLPPRQRPVFGPRPEAGATPQYAGYGQQHEPNRPAQPTDQRYPGFAGARNEPAVAAPPTPVYQQPSRPVPGAQGRPAPPPPRNVAAPTPDFGRQGHYRETAGGFGAPAGGYPPPGRQQAQSPSAFGQKPAAGYPFDDYAGGRDGQQPVDLDAAAARGFDGDFAGHPWPSMDEAPTAPPPHIHGHMDAPHLGGVDHDGAPPHLGDPAHHGGEFEAGYADEEYEYEDEEPAPRRGRMMMAAMTTGALVMLGVVFYGYNIVIGDSGSNTPPVIKSAEAPSKVKPLDAGGKKFAHTDSKVMGRLGDGSSSESELDSNGSRKVSTMVVGRDGSIQAPQASEDMAASATSVPGLTVVDTFGSSSESSSGGNSGAVTTTAALPELPQENPTTPSPPATPSAPKVVNGADAEPPAKARSSTSSSSSSSRARQVARATPAPEPSRPATTTTGNGYVAVLASIPKSDSSRMAALERFADLQQKYSGALSGRTPDVSEAKLGAKGTYHRLVVGPPGSRQSASTVCSDLKQAGYSDCWVTAY